MLRVVDGKFATISHPRNTEGIPYVALVGDIGIPYTERYAQVLKMYSEVYKVVFVVPGNVEYHHQMVGEVKKNILNVVNRFDNVILLDNSHVDLPGGIRIIGTTLWSHIPPGNIRDIVRTYPDFKIVRVGIYPHGSPVRNGKVCGRPIHKRMFTVEDINSLHRACVGYLQREILSAEKLGLRVVVLSHHAPSFRSINPAYKRSRLNCAYATDMSGVLRANVIAWGHGHTHYRADYWLQRTRVVSDGVINWIDFDESDCGPDGRSPGEVPLRGDSYAAAARGEDSPAAFLKALQRRCGVAQ